MSAQKKVTETDREEALTILRRDYWSDVRSHATEVKRAIKRGEIETVDQIEEYVHQSVEGDQRVIYTARAIETILFAESAEDDAIEACALETLKTPEEIYTCIAYWGLRGDVLRQLGDLDTLLESPVEEGAEE